MTTSVNVKVFSEAGELLEDLIVSGPMNVEGGSDRDQQVNLSRKVRVELENSDEFYGVEDA